MDALLGGSGPIITNPSTSPSQTPTPTSTPTSELDPVDEEEFANLNGLDYTLDQLIGNEDHTHGILNPTVSPSHPPTPREPKDVSVTREESDNEDGPSQSALDHASVALKVGPSNLPWTVKGVPKPGNKMFYCVIYLAPGYVRLVIPICIGIILLTINVQGLPPFPFPLRLGRRKASTFRRGTVFSVPLYGETVEGSFRFE